MVTKSLRQDRPTTLREGFRDARSYAGLALAGVSRRVLTGVVSRWDGSNGDAMLRHAGIDVDGLTRAR